MSRLQQLTRIAEISALHRRRAGRRLEAAAKLEQQRQTMAKDGRAAQADVARRAETYIARRFAALTQDDCSGAFLSSLAFGHRQANLDAAAAVIKADRLAERHRDAVKARAKQARALLRAEQVMVQHIRLADDAVAAALSDIDAAEDHEAHDIHAGKIQP